MAGRSDNFNRANSSTSLGIPSDGGSGWIAQSGTWGINGNAGYNVDGGSQETAVLQCGQPNGSVTITWGAFTSGSGQPDGFVVRATDANNYWLLAVGASNGETDLWKVQAGGFSQVVAQSGLTLTSGSSLSLVLAGNVYTLKQGATTVFTYTDTSNFNTTATKHGLRSETTTTQRFSAFAFVPPTATAFTIAGNPGASVGNAYSLTIIPNGALAVGETVTVVDDLGNTIGSLTFSSGAFVGQTLSWTPTSGQVGVRTLTATPSPSLGTPPSLGVTVYGLTLTPATQSVTGAGTATLTAVLTGGPGALSASVPIGALSTAAPVSGTPFTLTPPNATGTATVMVIGPGGASATATVIYSPGAGLTSCTTVQGFPPQFAALRGTVGFSVFNGDGTTYQVRNTANVAELPAGSGNYLGQFGGAGGTQYVIVWDTGGGGPLYGTPDVTPG